MANVEDNNLFSFYSELAQYMGIESMSGRYYSCVRAKHADWPNYVFKFDVEQSGRNEIFLEIATKMRNREIPPFLILNENSIDREGEEDLEKLHLRKIDRWPVMSLAANSFQSQDKFPSQFQSIIVNNQSELMDWFSIIKDVLFIKKSIEFELFNHLFAKRNFVFILGLLNNVPVSTAMLYVNEGIAGVYMVATVEKYRGQGFGKQITEYAIEKAKNLSQKSVTLQSSREGFPLYTNLGFSFLHNLNVYWMIFYN